MTAECRVGVIAQAQSAVLTAWIFIARWNQSSVGLLNVGATDATRERLPLAPSLFDFGLWRPSAPLQSGGTRRFRHRAPRQRAGKSSAHAAVTLDPSGDHFELGDFLPGRRH
jgi:hypothetical protein